MHSVLFNSEQNFNKTVLSVPVSFRFSQGLLNLMCHNLTLKSDINFFFLVLRRQRPEVYNWFANCVI